MLTHFCVDITNTKRAMGGKGGQRRPHVRVALPPHNNPLKQQAALHATLARCRSLAPQARAPQPHVTSTAISISKSHTLRIKVCSRLVMSSFILPASPPPPPSYELICPPNPNTATHCYKKLQEPIHAKAPASPALSARSSFQGHSKNIQAAKRLC